MIEEMKTDCIELSITACEKFAANYEVKNILFMVNVEADFYLIKIQCLFRWRQKPLKMQWIKSLEHFGMLS